MLRSAHLGLFVRCWKELKFCYVPRSQYARRTRQAKLPIGPFLEQDSADTDPDDPLGFSQRNANEEMEDWMDIENMKKLDVVQREEKIRKEKLLKQIIQRKYFKPPQELNLLTWDAKEQIRYLHQEYPGEWTVDRLVDSFPISKDGIARLLKSRFQPKTLKELVSHDNKVRQNWKSLLEGDKSGPLVGRYDRLTEKGQVHLLQNAAGIKSLPRNNWEDRVLSPGSQTAMDGAGIKTKRPGLFESIVMDYCEQKKLKEENTKDTSESPGDRLTDYQEQNKKLLANITKKQLKLNQKLASQNTANLPNDKSDKDGTSKPRSDVHFKQDVWDNNIEVTKDLFSGSHNSTEKLPLSSQSNVAQQTSSSKNDDHDEMFIQGSGKKNRPRLLRKKRTTIFEFLQMSNDSQVPETGKESVNAQNIKDDGVNTDTSQVEQQINIGMAGTSKHLKDDPASVGYIHPQSTHKAAIKQTILDRMTLNDPDGSSISPYIYDTEKGYQYPFGRVDGSVNSKLPLKPKANQKYSHNTLMYQTGKDFYDEDGEFLFRIP